MLKPLTFILIILLSLPGLCQEDDGTASAVPMDEEDPAQEAAEYRKTQIRGHKSLEIANDALNVTDELQLLGKEKLHALSLMDDKVQAELQLLIKKANLSSKAPEEIRESLENQMAGTKVEKLFKRFPKLLDAGVDLLRDQDALPGLIRVLGRKKDLKNYLYISLSIFVFAILFRRFYLKKRLQEMSFFKRQFISLGTSIFFSTVTLFIFYSIFKKDLQNTVSIIGKNFF